MARRVAVLIVLVAALLTGLGVPAHAAAPVVANQTVSYDLTDPDPIIAVSVVDGGLPTTVDCATTSVGELSTVYWEPGTVYLEFLRDGITRGSYAIACSAANASGRVTFTLTLTIVGTFNPGAFHAVPPARLYDSRWPGEGPVLGGGMVAIHPGGFEGIPLSRVGAIVANVTVTQPEQNGYVFLYPSNTDMPNVSNVNYGRGETVPNLVTVAVGVDGDTWLVNRSLGSTHVVVDIAGYYDGGPTAPLTAGAFTSVNPVRVLDTRTGTGSSVARAVPPEGIVTVKLPIPEPTGLGAAAVLNLTVTQPTSNGVASVYPGWDIAPVASNVNFAPGQTIANSVVVQTNSRGEVTFRNHSNGTLHFVADLWGFFQAGSPTIPGMFQSVYPTRILDTRLRQGTTTSPVGANGSFDLSLGASGKVPVGAAQAVVMNVTVTEPTRNGFISVYPNIIGTPSVSNLNYAPGQTVPNLATVAVNPDDTVTFRNASAGSVQLVADLAGYYLAGPSPAARAAHRSLPAHLP